MINNSLSDNRIVILGGTSGIGLAVAKAAIAEGASVIVGSHNEDNVASAVSRLGSQASGCTVDLKDEDSVAGFFAKMGKFNHMVYSAGDWERRKTSIDASFDLGDAQNSFAV